MKIKITCKMCRREGVSLCGREKCAVKRRPYPPGVHGPKAHRRPTGYGLQLREKQKARRTYGVTERQFQKYFENAKKKRGDTGEILVRELELRLDNVIYRLGWAKTRSQARQLVSHGHITIDEKKVTIPSYSVRAGALVGWKPKSGEGAYVRILKESLDKHMTPSWLKREGELAGKVLSEPEGKELEQIFDPKLIVEFYSR